MGKYTDSFADERTWRSVRVTECKDSGVAAACATWRQNCGKDADKIVRDPETQDAAGKAIHAMSMALDAAKKKLQPACAKNKITPVMRSPYNETRILLHDWEAVLDGYHKRLMEAGTRYHGATIKRKQYLKNLSLDQVAADRELWPEFLKHCAGEHNREAADAYGLCRQRQYQKMVKLYGKGNDYNLDKRVNDDLVSHFINGQDLPPGRLTEIEEKAEDALAFMLEKAGCSLDRFKESAPMEK